MSEKGEDYAVAFVEGSISRPSDEPRLKRIREQAAVLVALGACAHLGGINAIRNAMPLDDVRQYVYWRQGRTGTRPTRPGRSARWSRWIDLYSRLPD